jgi:hypothetical protein
MSMSPAPLRAIGEPVKIIKMKIVSASGMKMSSVNRSVA